MTEAPAALYVHIPWCIKKCPYCDFNSHARQGELPEQEYLNALERDARQQGKLFHGRTINSVFIGGGTPSLFSAKAIGQLSAMIGRHFSLDPHAEITLEANPGAVEQNRFRDFRAAGVNRISLGVQSFSDTALKALGRVHCADDAQRAVETIQRCGFEHWNIDLMHGLPKQTIKEAMQDLQRAIDLSARHISWYQLTIEANTTFYNRPPTLPNEDILADIQDAGQTLLSQSGLEQYEISAYASAGEQCQHNLNYWRFGDYAAIGAGAHGKCSKIAGKGHTMQIQRYWHTRQPEHYMDAIDGVAGQRELSADDGVFEFMLNALRLNEGFTEKLFQSHTGQSIDCIADKLADLCGRQLLEKVDAGYAATSLGRRYLNDVVSEFLSDG